MKFPSSPFSQNPNHPQHGFNNHSSNYQNHNPERDLADHEHLALIFGLGVIAPIVSIALMLFRAGFFA